MELAGTVHDWAGRRLWLWCLSCQVSSSDTGRHPCIALINCVNIHSTHARAHPLLNPCLT
jgi:hypothetical protein